MPEMDGVAVLKAIKELSPETTMMMITAYTMHKLVEEAKREGVKAVFPKPLDIDKMIAYTDGLVKKHKVVDEPNAAKTPDLIKILEEKRTGDRRKEPSYRGTQKGVGRDKGKPCSHG